MSCPGRVISVQSLGEVRSIWLNACDHTFHVFTEMWVALAATCVHWSLAIGQFTLCQQIYLIFCPIHDI